MNVSSDIENEDICFICKEDGRLLCCDNCYRTFHLTCLGIKNTPRGRQLAYQIVIFSLLANKPLLALVLTSTKSA